MIYFLLFVCLLLTVIVSFLAYYCFKFAKIILDFQDSIGECISILDERSSSIEKVLQIPLFYDSLEIRKVHEDIKKSRDAILKVAERMSSVEVEEDDGEE